MTRELDEAERRRRFATAVKLGPRAAGHSSRLIARLRVRTTDGAIAAGVAAGSVLAALLFSWYSLRLHRSFHSNGWDLGLIDQVIWNSAHGHPFEYSFREMSYLGDHFQPFLLLFVPLNRLFPGPEPLLIVQSAGLAGAALPLFLAVRRLAGAPAAAGLACAYLLSLGVSRAVAFDFHVEAFAPLLAFFGLLALTSGRKWGFIVAAGLLASLKEDGALLAISLAWVAWFAFGWRRVAAITGAGALAYGAVATAVVIPHFRGAGLNPLRERYGYLGDSLPEIAMHSLRYPNLVVEQLLAPEALLAVGLVLVAFAGLSLLVPRLLPPLAVVTALPLLSQEPQQGRLELHYLLAPTVVGALLAAIALRNLMRVASPREGRNRRRIGLGGGLVAVAATVLLIGSPLPPSFAANWDRFEVDRHAEISQSFVDAVPADAVVSAQSAFVAHLAERRHIFQFPRIADAEFVLVDKYGPIPADDRTAGYAACLAVLDRLGFDLVRDQEGIRLWRRTRPAEVVAGLPSGCAGQHLMRPPR